MFVDVHGSPFTYENGIYRGVGDKRRFNSGPRLQETTACAAGILESWSPRRTPNTPLLQNLRYALRPILRCGVSASEVLDRKSVFPSSHIPNRRCLFGQPHPWMFH